MIRTSRKIIGTSTGEPNSAQLKITQEPQTSDTDELVICLKVDDGPEVWLSVEDGYELTRQLSEFVRAVDKDTGTPLQQELDEIGPPPAAQA